MGFITYSSGPCLVVLVLHQDDVVEDIRKGHPAREMASNQMGRPDVQMRNENLKPKNAEKHQMTRFQR